MLPDLFLPEESGFDPRDGRRITGNYHMLSADVVVAGGGAAGLLIASALAPTCSVLLVEQSDNLPRNKYSGPTR